MLKKIINTFLTVFGFLLSPLSWWNDLVFNIPISYFLAYPFGLINKEYFYVALITIYWATNILGVVFMQIGVRGLIKKEGKIKMKDMLLNLLFCCLYSSLIIVLIQLKILTFPI